MSTTHLKFGDPPLLVTIPTIRYDIFPTIRYDTLPRIVEYRIVSYLRYSYDTILTILTIRIVLTILRYDTIFYDIYDIFYDIYDIFYDIYDTYEN